PCLLPVCSRASCLDPRSVDELGTPRSIRHRGERAGTVPSRRPARSRGVGVEVKDIIPFVARNAHFAASVVALFQYAVWTPCTGWATWSLYVRVFPAIWRHFSLDMLQICGVIHLTYDPLLIRDHGQEDQSLRLEDRGTTSPELFQPPSRSRYRSSLR